MRAGITIFASLLLAGPTLADEAADIEYGRLLALENCATCHAIDRVSESTHPDAPPFRVLSQRYPLEGLEEALAEGIVTGHPDMPEFIATPPQIAGIIAYMRSICERTE
jgi:mono/diheme cytochrome c family protein